jgi:serine/threonine protein kinase
VIDFGIAWAADATMTRSGLRFGTPSWMAPEQLRDQPAGPPADVFAWGSDPRHYPDRAPDPAHRPRRVRCSGPEPGRYIRSGASMPIRSRVLARTWRVALTSHQRALERARSSLRTRHSA